MSTTTLTPPRDPPPPTVDDGWTPPDTGDGLVYAASLLLHRSCLSAVLTNDRAGVRRAIAAALDISSLDHVKDNNLAAYADAVISLGFEPAAPPTGVGRWIARPLWLDDHPMLH